MKQAVFTIASKNYFSYVKTLMQSLKEFEPDWDRYVVLVDEYLDEGKEKPLIEDPGLYEIIKAADLGLPNPQCMFFRYSILELNTAVKPWGFEWLFKGKGYDTVVYMDPDTCVFNRMAELERELEIPDTIVLTPHVTSPVPDSNIPNEQELMRFGVYNLGFLGLSKGKGTADHIQWWEKKLEYNCVEDLPNGVYVDQKWMDIVPAFYDNVKILRHPGYNVAYWNLVTKKVTAENGKYYLNGEQLAFFHFSHVHLLNTDIQAVKELADDYYQRQIKNNVEEIKNLPYAYDKFEDGIKIPYPLRVMYRKDRQMQKIGGDNPFKNNSVFMTEPAVKGEKDKIPITVLMDCIWKIRPDAQQAFPKYMHEQRDLFVRWFISVAEKEYNIDKSIVDAARASLKKAYNIRNGSLKVKTVRFAMATGMKMRPVLLKVLPFGLRNRLYNRFLRMSASTIDFTAEDNGLHNAIADVSQANKGINLYSFIKGEFSIGEVGRIIARGLNTTDIPFSIVNLTAGGNLHSFRDSSWDHKVTDKPDHNINLFAINADSVMYYRSQFDPDIWKNRYNIGYWNWELPDFPDRWKKSFSFFNEIWTGARFVVDSLSEKSPVPVVRIPLTVKLTPNRKMDRAYFNLPEDRFLFLCMYDVLSIQSRKNPQGAVHAFIKAFQSNNKNVGLVIKVNNAQNSAEDMAILNDIVKGYENVYIMDKTFSREEIDSLLNCIDVFVSLHRSEGFGLVLAEAMYLKKPVIATNWSANTDFMDYTNSCPVDYKLVQIGKDFGPYEAYQQWAEPNEDHAAEYMKRLFSDRAYYDQLAASGQKKIKSDYSPEVMGSMMLKRLQSIGLL